MTSYRMPEDLVRQTLAALVDAPAGEAEVALTCGCSGPTARRRLVACRDRGFVESEKIKPGSQYSPVVWRLTAAGATWLATHRRSAAEPPPEVRRRLLSLIHVAKRDLGLTEDDYRAVLASFKVDSAAELDLAGLNRLVDHFRGLGFKVRLNPPGSGRPRKLSPPSRQKDWKDQVDKLRALWIELAKTGTLRDPSEEGLRRWAARTCGTDRLEWLTVEQAQKAIEGLKEWLRRAQETSNA